MKKITIYTLLLALVLPLTATAQEQAIKSVAKKFVKSADDQDPELLNSILYENAQQFVLFRSKVLQSSAQEYVAQIRDKKLGGKPREIQLETVLTEGDDVGYVKLKAIGGGLVFSYQLTLFKIEQAWKIMTITTKATQAGE